MLDHPADKRLNRDGFVLHPVGAVGAVMGGDPCAILAIDAPDRDRRADHILRHLACHALRLRGALPLLDVGHQAVRIFPDTGIHPLVNGFGLQRLAEHRQPMPLPRAPEHRVGQVREMLPARPLGIVAPTGREEMQRGMVRPMTPMRVGAP